MNPSAAHKAWLIDTLPGFHPPFAHLIPDTSMPPRMVFISADGPGTLIESEHNNVRMISGFSDTSSLGEMNMVGIEGKNGARVTTYKDNVSLQLWDTTEIYQGGKHSIVIYVYFPKQKFVRQTKKNQRVLRMNRCDPRYCLDGFHSSFKPQKRVPLRASANRRFSGVHVMCQNDNRTYQTNNNSHNRTRNHVEHSYNSFKPHQEKIYRMSPPCNF